MSARTERLKTQIDRLDQKLAANDPRVSEVTLANYRVRRQECVDALEIAELEDRIGAIRKRRAGIVLEPAAATLKTKGSG